MSIRKNDSDLTVIHAAVSPIVVKRRNLIRCNLLDVRLHLIAIFYHQNEQGNVMKKIFLMILISLSTSLFAQNFWETHVSAKTEGKEYLVFAENCNVRASAALDGKVAFMLQPGDKVKVVEPQGDPITIKGRSEFWYKIEFKGKSGYLWGGLLADDSAVINEKTFLIRNEGVKNQKMELKILSGGKLFAKTEWESGPVNSLEGHKIKQYSTKSLKNPPDMIFSVGYFEFSEIEGGQWMEELMTLKGTVLTRQLNWCPGACDPPSCSETFMLFPDDKLAADPKIKRKEYKGISNGIREITDSYSTDDEFSHEFYVHDFMWNGTDFKAKK